MQQFYKFPKIFGFFEWGQNISDRLAFVEILNVEMERVDEQTVQMYDIPNSMLESDKSTPTHTNIQIDKDDCMYAYR